LGQKENFQTDLNEVEMAHAPRRSEILAASGVFTFYFHQQEQVTPVFYAAQGEPAQELGLPPTAHP